MLVSTRVCRENTDDSAVAYRAGIQSCPTPTFYHLTISFQLPLLTTTAFFNGVLQISGEGSKVKIRKTRKFIIREPNPHHNDQHCGVRLVHA